ncbi:ribokinase [Rhizobium oryzicola]|uniref:Ribokinase n=1 Tax=Rhizobium oryzicola TaxID=1232668 RepID=A0ABT8SS39_9HYPH|nr:ribokinase [Rhizobium oryzicola]MDO1580833.1 ribokinase [Rhizobium oryzicola]
MITVFGSINMDLIATTARLPQPGETVPGDTFSTAAGGKGANQALAAARAGARVKMAGAVGRDAFAEPALALLGAAHVDLRPVKKVDGPTGTALILVGGDGENMIAVVPGANGTITAEDAQTAVSALQEDDILMLQMEIPAEAVEAALVAAGERAVTTIFNTAPFTQETARLAKLATIIVSNETEFDLLVGRGPLDDEQRIAAIHEVHATTGQTLVVTLGAKGAAAIHQGHLYHMAGLKIEPVDTVGAGDTFCGYLAATLDEGMPFPAAVHRAAIAGSLACLKPGAQPAIPLGSEVAAAING